MWGATYQLQSSDPIRCISIHAPRVGSDRGEYVPQIPGRGISIHAPRVGSDPAGSQVGELPGYFNPRSPCGERLLALKMSFGTGDFNPRSPCGERHDVLAETAKQLNISIHAPRVGSDSKSTLPIITTVRFQSTLPVWGATLDLTLTTSRATFQSTLPVWGATAARSRSSIRASFQSTLPVWGATPPAQERRRLPPNFNPRSPCGERRCFQFSRYTPRPISIHAPRVGSDQRRHRSLCAPRHFNPRSPCGERPGQADRWCH